MKDPRWHGDATPDQVREMMMEMYIFLIENNEHSDFITAEAAKEAVESVINAYL